MTTARVLIQRGYREDNLIPVGREPSAAEFAEGLSCLNGYLLSAYSHDIGETMADWPAPQPQRTAPVAANFPQLPYPYLGDPSVMPLPQALDLSYNVYPFPPVNSRLVWGGNTLRAYMPESPRMGSRFAFVQGSGAGSSGAPGAVLTLDANGRDVEQADLTVATTVTLTNPAAPLAWFYRADTGVWRLVRAMGADDDCPFPEEFDDYWITMLSIRLAPRYSKQISEGTKLAAQRMQLKIKQACWQTTPTVYKSDDIPRALESYASGRWFW